MRAHFNSQFNSQFNTHLTLTPKFIPSVGMFCPQRGNILFPAWEQYAALCFVVAMNIDCE